MVEKPKSAPEAPLEAYFEPGEISLILPPRLRLQSRVSGAGFSDRLRSSSEALIRLRDFLANQSHVIQSSHGSLPFHFIVFRDLLLQASDPAAAAPAAGQQLGQGQIDSLFAEPIPPPGSIDDAIDLSTIEPWMTQQLSQRALEAVMSRDLSPKQIEIDDQFKRYVEIEKYLARMQDIQQDPRLPDLTPATRRPPLTDQTAVARAKLFITRLSSIPLIQHSADGWDAKSPAKNINPIIQSELDQIISDLQLAARASADLVDAAVENAAISRIQKSENPQMFALLEKHEKEISASLQRVIKKGEFRVLTKPRLMIGRDMRSIGIIAQPMFLAWAIRYGEVNFPISSTILQRTRDGFSEKTVSRGMPQRVILTTRDAESWLVQLRKKYEKALEATRGETRERVTHVLSPEEQQFLSRAFAQDRDS